MNAKLTSIILLLLLFLNSAGFQLTSRRVPPPTRISLIPKPANMRVMNGSFTITPETVVIADKASQETGALFVRQLAPAMGHELKLMDIADVMSLFNSITLEIAQRATFPEEGYSLDVSKNRVMVKASTQAGIFYACQTLRQLLPPEILGASKVGNVEWSMPQVHIKDEPRFGWRGLMHDASRTFLPIDYLKKTIDRMALYKMNVFHLHLSDDQGWRLEIKKYPQLTDIGSNFEKEYDKPSGFYSQDDIRELVRCAAERHIMIVPEIDIPGHSRAMLKSMPELGCIEGKEYRIYPFSKGKNFVDSVLCAGKDNVYDVLDDITAEMVELFPTPYIHMGGDEVNKSDWGECDNCQTKMKNDGLANEKELQTYFSNRVTKLIMKHGKRAVGWNEILNPNLDKDAVVMSWQGVEPGIKAIKAGHDVVFSPNAYTYFNRPESVRSTYSWEPIPEDFTKKEAARVLGIEGCQWSHKRRTDMDALDMAIYPRFCAVAERAWSPGTVRDWPNFRKRLLCHYPRLEALGIPFFHSATIAKIMPNSAAEKAGLKVGDNIIEFDGEDIMVPFDVGAPIRNNNGKTVTVIVQRGKKTLNLQAQISIDPKKGRTRKDPKIPPVRNGGESFGIFFEGSSKEF
ncbi:family 20 glycosylhydrolase [Candidatus Hydrogenedentota bacterium]